MTGFGRAEGLVANKKVTVEMRSLNSKQLDLFLKLPQAYKDKDGELRQWLTERIVRGKCEVFIGAEAMPGTTRTQFDLESLRANYAAVKTIAHELDPTAQTDLLGFVLRMPDAANNNNREAVDAAEWAAVRALIDAAVKDFHGFREAEGAKLEQDLRMRCDRITALLNEVETQDSGRAERTRERLRTRLAELQAKVDQDRFEQELIFYLEKMDINEEKVRLRTHAAYFLETLAQDEQQGRKLGFITQEMGREINTIGSKANDAVMQRNVVLMKDELEKIKEQVLNVL